MRYLFGLAVFACVYLLEFNFAHASLPVCAPDLIAPCADLKSAPLNSVGNTKLGIPTSQKGDVTLNLYPYLAAWETPKGETLKEELYRLSTPSPGQMKDTLALAEKLRLRAIKLLEQNLSEKNLTGDQRAALSRLQNLKILFFAFDDESNVDQLKKQKCGQERSEGEPNAAYDPESNAILICPATGKQSASYLVHALSHELGHVVSPCTSGLAGYKVNPAKLAPAVLAQCDSSLIPREGQPNPDGDLVDKLFRYKSAYVNQLPSNSLVRALEKCEVLEYEEGSIVREPELFKTTSACIARSTRAFWEARNLQEAQEASVQFKTPIALELKRREPKDPPACLGNAAEQFGDSFEAELLGAWAQENSWSKTNFKQALLILRGRECVESEKPDSSSATADYPKASTRLQALLSNPDVAAKLDCAPASTKGICPLRFETPLDKNNSLAPAPAKAPRSSSSRSSQ